MTRNILVIDDDDSILGLVGGFLRPRGWRVFYASSAEEGILVASQQNPEVILLDFGLPRMTGLQAAAEFGRLSSAPVVMMGGTSDEGLEAEARRVGARGVLRKPMSLEELESGLKSALGG